MTGGKASAMCRWFMKYAGYRSIPSFSFTSTIIKVCQFNVIPLKNGIYYHEEREKKGCKATENLFQYPHVVQTILEKIASLIIKD